MNNELKELNDNFQRIFIAISVIIPKVDTNFLSDLQTNLLLEDDPDLLDEHFETRYILEIDPTERHGFHIETLKRTERLMVPMFYRSVNIHSHVIELAYKQLMSERYSLDTELEYYSFPSIVQIINMYKYSDIYEHKKGPVINCIIGPKYLTVYTIHPKALKGKQRAANIEIMCEYLRDIESEFIQSILDNNRVPPKGSADSRCDFEFIEGLYKRKLGILLRIYPIN